jgi:ubiquinone/menaquinone biosynthesis C-methylase UbiE
MPCPLSEPEIRDLLVQYRRENWRGIQTLAIQDKVVEDLMRCDADGLLNRVAPYVHISETSRLLDLGSGVGSFVVACRKRGLRCFGIEPDRIGNGIQLTSIQIARRRVTQPVFAAAVGESLPFADRTFDLVAMNQVIEHVSDQSAVLREATRVLRDGGVLYVACPNYLRFYEPHYKIFWLPLMPKILGRAYLRLRGRRPVMLEQITYTTNRRLHKLLRSLGEGYAVLDLHREQFLKKRAEGSFAAWSTRLVSHLTYLPVVGPLVLRSVLWFGSIREGGCEWVVIRRLSSTEC